MEINDFIDHVEAGDQLLLTYVIDEEHHYTVEEVNDDDGWINIQHDELGFKNEYLFETPDGNAMLKRNPDPNERATFVADIEVTN